MRVISQLAFAALLLAAAACASLVTREHVHSSESGDHHLLSGLHHKSHHRRGASAKSPMGPNNYGHGYMLMDGFGTALVARNYSMAGEYLDDNGVFWVADKCNFMTKNQFLSHLMESPMFTRAIFFQLGEWVGYNNNSVLFHSTTAAVLSNNTGAAANTTVVDKDVWLYGRTNADGTKFDVFEEATNQNDRQSNSTDMLRVWKDFKDAVLLRDIDAIGKTLSDDVALEMIFAWDQYPMQVVSNKTSVLSYIKQGWFSVHRVSVDVMSAYAACDIVMTQFIWTAIHDDGSTEIMNFNFGLTLDANMKIVNIRQQAMKAFAN